MTVKIYILVFMVLCGSATAQNTDCKVMLQALSGTYNGECKKGFAQGHGVAQGVDRYEGDFKKGLPDGKGVYTWANGNYYDGSWTGGKRDGQGKMVYRDSVVNGIWKADVYQGVKKGPPYIVRLSRNVQRTTINKTVESGDGVRIRILLGGSDNVEIEDFSLAFNSGNEYRSGPFYGIQYASLPLEVTVRYRTWNQLHTAQYDVVYEFTIVEHGIWSLTLINM